MRILILAPVGALIACASGTGNLNGEETPGSYSEQDNDSGYVDPDDVTASLRGDYATCNDALVGLGFTPWTDYVEEETADEFWVSVDEEGEANLRPWIATLTCVTDDCAEYHITCGDSDRGEAHMWVDRAREEYWSCTFQYDRIGILDPESDPDCTKGLSEQAIRVDFVEGENYRYNLAEPGLYVVDEE